MTWSGFWLLLKWLPQLLEIAKQLEVTISEEVLQFKLKKQGAKIDLIFISTKPIKERAAELDDIFKL